jgi:hypothetical protein
MRDLWCVTVALGFVPLSIGAQDSMRRDSTQLMKTVEVRGSATGLGQVRTGNAIGKLDLQQTPSGTSPYARLSDSQG